MPKDRTPKSSVRSSPYGRPARTTANTKSYAGQDTDDDGNAEDMDWLLPDPSRPSPPANLWGQVYTALTPANGNLTIACEEKGGACSQGGTIELTHGYKEIGGRSTPHNLPRKPPVCHIIPWAALKVVLEEQKDKAKQDFSPAFIRDVCWHVPNLRTGHNGCNAGGTKTTAASVRPAEKRAAQAIFDDVKSDYGGQVH